MGPEPAAGEDFLPLPLDHSSPGAQGNPRTGIKDGRDRGARRHRGGSPPNRRGTRAGAPLNYLGRRAATRSSGPGGREGEGERGGPGSPGSSGNVAGARQPGGGGAGRRGLHHLRRAGASATSDRLSFENEAILAARELGGGGRGDSWPSSKAASAEPPGGAGRQDCRQPTARGSGGRALPSSSLHPRGQEIGAKRITYPAASKRLGRQC